MGGILGTALLTSLVALILSMMGFGAHRLVGVVGIVGIYLYLVGRVDNILEYIFGFPMGEVSLALDTALRMIGVGYAFGVVADVVGSMGHKELSEGIISVGRVEILALSLPYIGEIIDTVSGFL